MVNSLQNTWESLKFGLIQPITRKLILIYALTSLYFLCDMI